MPVYRVRLGTYIRQTTAHLSRPAASFSTAPPTVRHPSGDELVDREAADPKRCCWTSRNASERTKACRSVMYKVCRCAGEGAADEALY